jgi:hypothetical protein
MGRAELSGTELQTTLERNAEAVQTVHLLAALAHRAQLEVPALDGLAALLDGRIEPAGWQTVVGDPNLETRRQVGVA